MEKLFARLTLSLALLLLALALAAIAIAFLCGALYFELATVMMPPLAALATGGAALIVALLVALAARLLMGRSTRARRRADRASGLEAEGLAGEFGGVIGEEIAAFAQRHSRSTVTVSLLAGFAVGFSPRLRRALLRLLKP